MRRSRAVMSLDRPSQLTLNHGLSVDSKEIAPNEISRRPPQLCAGLMGIAIGSPDDVEIVQRGYKSDGASLDRSRDSLKDMSRFESGMSLDRDPIRRREMYNRHCGHTFDEENKAKCDGISSRLSDSKLRSKNLSAEESSPVPSKRSVHTFAERKKSRTDCESASSLQDSNSMHSSGGGLFEKHFGRNKKQHKLEKSKRLSTSALYDRSPTEAFYNKTGSMRLSATELFEKFCSEDFSSLYGPGSHYDDVFKEDVLTKDYRRESRSSPHIRTKPLHKSDKNIERSKSTADNNSAIEIIEEFNNFGTPNTLSLSAHDIMRKPTQLSLSIQNYNVTDQYELCVGATQKKKHSFKRDIIPSLKDRPLFEWCNSEFRPIDDEDSPTVGKLIADAALEEIPQDDSTSFLSDVFASNEDVSLHQDNGNSNKISRGRLVHQRGIDKEEMTSSLKSNSTTIEEESLSSDRSPADTYSVTERIELYDENPKRLPDGEKVSHNFVDGTNKPSNIYQFVKQEDEFVENNTLTKITERNNLLDVNVEVMHNFDPEDEDNTDKILASDISGKQSYSGSHSTLINEMLFESDKNCIKDATEQDMQSLIDYSSETEEISGFCDINEESMDKKECEASRSIWMAINAFEKIEKCAARAQQLREQMKDPNNSLCSSQEQNENENKFSAESDTQNMEAKSESMESNTRDIKTKSEGIESELSPVITKIPLRHSMQKLRLINIESIAMTNENSKISITDQNCPINSMDKVDAEISDQNPKPKSKDVKKSFFRLQKGKSDDILNAPKKSKCFPL